jgi:hypothetical protein
MVPGVDLCKVTYPCPCPSLSVQLTPNRSWDSNRTGIGKNHALKKRDPCGAHFLMSMQKGWRGQGAVEVHVAFEPPINKHGLLLLPCQALSQKRLGVSFRPAPSPLPPEIHN